MRSILKGITMGLLLVFVSCTRSGELTIAPELAQAEAVMFDYPDSALRLLQRMPMPSPKRDKANHALWCLLTTQAQYKQMMPIPSDSLIRIAYDYYKPTSDARRKAMSALYMGGVNYDLDHIDEANRYYLEAQTEMEKTNDNKLGYLVMSSLADMYLYRNLKDYALEACTQAYNYAVRDSNKNYQMTGLLNLARAHCLLGNLSRAILTYQQSAQIALDLGLGNDSYYYKIMHEIALVHKNREEFEESLKILKSFPVAFQSLALIGKNYLGLNRPDSAFYYLNKALKADSLNIYAKESIYEYLCKLGHRPEYLGHLSSYCDSLLFYQDSIMALDKSRAIIEYKEKYDNEKLVAEKQKLELDKANSTRRTLIVLLVALTLVFVLVYVYLRNKIAMHKKEEELANLALQLHEKELEVYNNEAYIAELQQQCEEDSKKETLLAELRQKNEQLLKEKNSLQAQVESYSVSSPEATNVRILLDKLDRSKKREESFCAQLLAQNQVLQELHSKPVYLDNKRLKELCKLADTLFQNFTEQLLKDVPTMNEHEIILCSLVKLRFSVKEIALFMNITPNTVSKNKLRLKCKICAALGKKESTMKSLDICLLEY